MQAIITKIIPATNTRPTRISASCKRGRIVLCTSSYTLTDTFNNQVISRHFSVVAAVKNQTRHLRAVRKANGKNSYLTYSITADDHRDISEEIFDAELSLSA